MSDFIYTKTKSEGLSEHLQSIYREDPPKVTEYHGKWGSLIVSENLYHGFQPYETSEYICVVIGGPVLCFQDNKHIAGEKASSEATAAIFERWNHKNLKLDEDLSGPFVLFMLNKTSGDISCMTDLMSFIPVYSYHNEQTIALATHVDMLAKVATQQKQLDLVSQVDFILYGAVTYPHTIYENIKQIAPATIHEVGGTEINLQSENYWIPNEEMKYQSINEAARDLRSGLESYVNSVTTHTDNVAQFLSGGEDSRVISALLAQKKRRNAYIFLEQENREGEIAERAAGAYDATLNIILRDKMHYVDMLPSCSDLVGGGSQYFHVHTFGMHKRCRFEQYDAVFGGLLADALLKGSHIRKLKGTHLVPFFPQIKRREFTAGSPIYNNVFKQEVLEKVQARRREHLEYINSFRSDSAEEWFELWPSSMNVNISNIHGNRRLFKSFEPFTGKDIVKISASIPQSWKLNRRLFQVAAKPFLKPTKWLFHGEGKLPYFPWYVNSFVQGANWTIREIAKRTKISRKYQGPWFEWNAILESKQWKEAVSNYSQGIKPFENLLNQSDVHNLFEANDLNYVQKINLLQMLYVNDAIADRIQSELIST